MEKAYDPQAFHRELLAAVKELRDRSARNWASDPVLAKTLEHIRDYVERLLSVTFTAESESVARAIWFDSLQHLDDLKLEAAFDIEADLRVRLLELAGGDYLRMCLQHEQQRLTKPPVENDPDRRWTDLFSEKILADLLNGLEGTDKEYWRGTAIERLAELYRQSHHELRRNRAHAAQTGRYLGRLWPVLAGLLLAMAMLLGSVDVFDWPTRTGGRWAELIAFGVAMLAGAVGGVLGLMFRFRDAHGRIRELLKERDIGWVQPLIGAAMALVVVLIIKSELITIAGFSARDGRLIPLAALGFLAGFSEPVFFGVIDRLGRATSSGPSQAKS